MNIQRGFTLIELVVVLVIIAILAVTAAPKLLGTNHFAHHGVRDQLISQLRLAQLRALNDRSGCYALSIDTSQFSLSRTSYNNGVCGSSYTALSATALADGVNVAIGAAVNNSTPLNIRFDSLGRPSGGHCSAGRLCTLRISAATTVNLCLESEGYVHDC